MQRIILPLTEHSEINNEFPSGETIILFLRVSNGQILDEIDIS